MTTQIPLQVFNVGDYVLTSKGKLGVVQDLKVELLSDYAKKHLINIDWYIDCESTIPGNYYLRNIDNTITNSYSNGFENEIDIKIIPLVKLGTKVYPINSDKLVKLNKLKIKTQQGFSQHVVELPIEDAKLLIDIYTRNNIWHVIIN